MDIETARALQTLREENLNLFDKLRSNQNTFRNLLGSLRDCRTSTANSDFGQRRHDLYEESDKYVKPREEISHKIHLYKRSFEDPKPNKTFDSDLTDVSDLTITSTPVKEVRDTPKSILKGRQIIEDHTKVDSKYEHTPSSRARSSRRNLNFSYNEMDDIDMLKKVIRNQLEIDMAVEDAAMMRRRELDKDEREEKLRNMREIEIEAEKLRRMENEEMLRREREAEQRETIMDSQGRSLEATRESEGSRDVEDLEDRRLLRDSGNDRQRAAIIRELSKRPKSIVFDINASQGREDFGTSSNQTTTTNQSLTRSVLRSSDAPNGPLLGYDFIAGLLDNESKLVDRSDAFYDELNEFRRVNKEECTGKHALADVIDLTRPISPEIKDPGHTCIHGYSINERLYPKPLNEDDEGESVCPVCLSTRKEPTQEEPAFVRVSIPRSSLQAPYKIKPHRRRSFDDTDNVALSKHCLAGWECSKPSMLPTASTVDLKHYADGLKSQLATTVQDIENMTAAYKILPRVDPVLDSSRSLRADVQYYAMDRSLHPLHTSAY